MSRLAKNLNGSDLGSEVTVTGNEWSLTGILLSVDHHADQVDVSPIENPGSRYVNGQTWVDLCIGPWSGTVPPDAVVTDADPSTPPLP